MELEKSSQLQQPSRKSREVFLNSGEPEDNEQRKEREEAARIRLVEKKEKDPELEEVIKQVDFGVLRKIFEEIAEKSGLNPRLMNFIRPERIAHWSLSVGAAGSYSVYENIIGISYQELKKWAKQLNISPQIVAIHILCHEETHATGKVECRGLEQWWADPNLKQMSKKMGFARIIEERNKPIDFLFHLFDEGVTEKLSREVLQEYIRRADFQNKEAIAGIRRVLVEKPIEMPYAVPVKFVEALIAKISHETGINQSVVWQAIIRGMYEGEDFKDPELRDLFAETISPDFLDKLAGADQPYKLDELMSVLTLPQKDTTTPASTKNKILSWLNRHITDRSRYRVE